MTPVLAVRDVRKRFAGGWRQPPIAVLRGVSLTVGRGEAVAVVGASGSGKSTLARIIARSVDADAGEIRVAGELAPRGRPPLAYRRRVQMIFQDPFGSLNPARSVGHHIERPLLRHRIASSRADARRRCHELLERCGLAPGPTIATVHPHELSGGQCQRVAIARAIAVEPALIVADEPTSMLDVSLRAGVLALLTELKHRQRIGFVYITHDLAAARQFADRIVVLHRGTIVEDGDAEAVIDTPRHDHTRRLLAAAPRIEPELAGGSRAATARGPVVVPFDRG